MFGRNQTLHVELNESFLDWQHASRLQASQTQDVHGYLVLFHFDLVFKSELMLKLVEVVVVSYDGERQEYLPADRPTRHIKQIVPLRLKNSVVC